MPYAHTQVVIAASQTYWTTEVAHAIKTGSLDKYCEQLHAQLGDLIQLVRGDNHLCTVNKA